MADTENLKSAFSALQSNSPSLAHSLMKNQTSFAGLTSPQAALSLALQNPVLFTTSPSQQLLPQQQSVSKQTTSPSPPSPSSSSCATSAGGRVSPHKKFRECAHCGTTKSSQWRRGPFKKAKYVCTSLWMLIYIVFVTQTSSTDFGLCTTLSCRLCNACGLRYSRNYAKRKQGKDKAITEARSDIYNLLN